MAYIVVIWGKNVEYFHPNILLQIYIYINIFNLYIYIYYYILYKSILLIDYGEEKNAILLDKVWTRVEYWRGPTIHFSHSKRTRKG